MIEYNVITWMSGGYSWRREPAPTIAGTLIESTQKSVVLATGLLFKRYKFLLIDISSPANMVALLVVLLE